MGITGEDQTVARGELDQISHYRILGELARGGMGVVYKALDTRFDRQVALKVILRERASAPMRERFHREARAAAQLFHPGIVKLHDMGSDRGVDFFTMDLIEGPSLADVLKRDTVDTRQCLRWIQDVCDAVHFAHTQGIFHRDLKPSNIMIDAGLRAVITDFGLAKDFTQQDDTALTRSGEPIGTFAYMAPELAQGQTFGALTDVYSLGVMIYEIVSDGGLPYAGNSPIELLAKLAGGKPVPLSEQMDHPDPALVAMTDKAISKLPIDRYISAKALSEDIERYLKLRSVHARPPGRLARLGRAARANPAISLLFALVMILALALAVTQGKLSSKSQQALARGEIEQAGKLYRAGSFPEALSATGRAQQQAPELAGGWYWEARWRIHELAELQQLPAPWVTGGLVHFLPIPQAPPRATKLRRVIAELLNRARRGRLEGLQWWALPAAEGVLDVLTGRYVAGERRLTTCLADPEAQEDAELTHYLALALYYRHRFHKAVEIARDSRLRVRALQAAALQDALQGRSREALALLKRALRQGVLQSEVLVRRAELRQRMGRTALAKADCEAALARTRDPVVRAEARVALSRGLELRGRRTEAIALARKAVADLTAALAAQPGHIGALMRRGFAYELIARMAQNKDRPAARTAAADDFTAVRKLAPGPQVTLALLRVTTPLDASRARYDRELSEQDQLLRRYPGYLPAYMARARSHWSLAEHLWADLKQDPLPSYQAARSDCDRALALNANYAEAFLERAKVHFRWGDYLLIHGENPTPLYKLVFADCDSALRLNPEMFEAYVLRAEKRISLGVYLIRSGKDPSVQWGAAIRDHTAALAINPENTRSYFNRAQARINLAQRSKDPLKLYALALADCELGIRHSKGPQQFQEQRAMANLYKGLAHREAGHRKRARTHLLAALRELKLIGNAPPANPDFTRYLIQRGRAACGLGRHAEARADYARAVKRGSREAQARGAHCANGHK